MEIKHINWGYILHFMPIQSKYYFLKEPLQKVIIWGWTTKSTAFEVCQKLNSQEQRKCCLITAFSVLKATSNESIKRKRLNPEIAVKFDLNTRSTKNQCYSDIISCMVCLSVTHNSLSLLSALSRDNKKSDAAFELGKSQIRLRFPGPHRSDSWRCMRWWCWQLPALLFKNKKI